MPQNKFALARYRIIDSLLRTRKRVKTIEMIEKCCDQTGFKVSKRTIELDIEAMRNDPFLAYFAPIEYDTSARAFYYTNQQFSLIPFCFTKHEVDVIEYLLSISTAKLTKEQHKEAVDLLEKIKMWL